jgi:fructose-1,6-bisphosphatase-3
MCDLIQNLAIDKLHIIGDIFDRGPRADIIMNRLMESHDVDIQWGNHDVDWMGAASGNPACVCNVLRIAISYNSFDVLEDGYGINLRPLSMFAAKVYRDDPCTRFTPKILDQNLYDAVDPGLAAKMHKAIAMIQFKVEGQIIRRHPGYKMDDRVLLENVDYENGTVMIGGKEYPMLDTYFPTIDPSYPLKLTAEEEELLHTLVLSFRHSDLLHKHIRFLYSNGALYKCCNGNLLYHGCIPMREDGSFESMIFDGQEMSGRELMDYIGEQIRRAYFLKDDALDKQNAVDFMWYLWCGAKSPVFGKDRMTTFENYFVEDKSTHKENFNPYYQLSQDEEVCNRILAEFDLPTQGSHIINGHVPVKIKDGETPVKANGKLYVIDGGLSKAYQKQTGIAGYTLIYNSHHLALAEHMPFHPDRENTPRVSITEKMPTRVLVGNTDKGEELKIRIADLCELVSAYRSGLLKEHD